MTQRFPRGTFVKGTLGAWAVAFLPDASHAIQAQGVPFSITKITNRTATIWTNPGPGQQVDSSPAAKPGETLHIYIEPGDLSHHYSYGIDGGTGNGKGQCTADTGDICYFDFTIPKDTQTGHKIIDVNDLDMKDSLSRPWTAQAEFLVVEGNDNISMGGIEVNPAPDICTTIKQIQVKCDKTWGPVTETSPCTTGEGYICPAPAFLCIDNTGAAMCQTAAH